MTRIKKYSIPKKIKKFMIDEAKCIFGKIQRKRRIIYER